MLTDTEQDSERLPHGISSLTSRPPERLSEPAPLERIYT